VGVPLRHRQAGEALSVRPFLVRGLVESKRKLKIERTFVRVALEVLLHRTKPVGHGASMDVERGGGGGDVTAGGEIRTQSPAQGSSFFHPTF
jgi:hypothetical protein